MPTAAPRTDDAAPRIRLGCAGWSIASSQRALVGDGASQLARYATRFDAVEINSTFYRAHRASTYQRWADSVPAQFRFSAKLPRTITHDARLQGVAPLLQTFLGEVGHLGDKLGCLLVQLPPRLAFDARTAATFFAMLRRCWHGAPRIYYSDYPDAALQDLAKRVVAATPHSREAWVLFDNTALGHALANAATLLAQLHALGSGAGS